MLTKLLAIAGTIIVAFAGAAPARATLENSEAVYVTQPGDSMRDLSLFFGVISEQLASANEGADAASLHGGSDLIIPGIRAASESAPSSLTTYVVQRGDTLFRIATSFSLSTEALADANDIPSPDRIYVGQTLHIPPLDYQARSLDERIADSAAPLPSEQIPQPTLLDGKQIVVDLSQQQTYVFENGVLLRHFLSSTGLPNTPTVVGDFAIYVKYDAQRMTGPGYDLPGVPWVMYFYRGYALHGAYWHNNFGNPMSHGCVNLRIAEAEWLYQWAAIGTPVHVMP